MARAYICDRCRILFEDKPEVLADYSIIRPRKSYESYDEAVIDLCPECQKDLEAFMKGEK